MEARELMIGDWVKVLPISRKVEAHNSQVGALTRNVNNTISIEGGYFPAWTGWSVGEEYIEPIPLTAEILEMNGFKERDKFAWYHKESLLLVNTPNTNKVSITAFNCCVVITYVHELQRALRCCGLWELAENFKV